MEKAKVPTHSTWVIATIQLEKLIPLIEVRAAKERLLLSPLSSSYDREYVRQLDIQLAMLRFQREELNNWSRCPPNFWDTVRIFLYRWATR